MEVQGESAEPEDSTWDPMQAILDFESDPDYATTNTPDSGDSDGYSEEDVQATINLLDGLPFDAHEDEEREKEGTRRLLRRRVLRGM